MSKKNVLSCCDIIAWSSKYVLKMDKMRMWNMKMKHSQENSILNIFQKSVFYFRKGHFTKKYSIPQYNHICTYVWFCLKMH
jgi:hypothetical protein